MSLIDVRKEINLIDDSMKKLFDERLNCSYEVAKVKMQEHDEIYKPAREIEICERFAGEDNYIVFIKKVMQISRKFQYKTFIDNDMMHDDFVKYASDNYGKVFSEGGTLKIHLNSDSKSEKGLNICDILSVVADTKLQIIRLEADGIANRINIELNVDNSEECKKEALMLAYMLFKETI